MSLGGLFAFRKGTLRTVFGTTCERKVDLFLDERESARR